MDLTRFLRKKSNSDTAASPRPADLLMPPPTASGAGALSSASSEEDNDVSVSAYNDRSDKNPR